MQPDAPFFAEPSSVHEALFRFAFSRLDNVAGELQTLLLPEVAAKLDFASLRSLPGSYLDPGLRERACDLLFAARLSAHEALVYLVFEHAGTPQAFLPVQLLGCMLRIW